jgi:hypothetical protein
MMRIDDRQFGFERGFAALCGPEFQFIGRAVHIAAEFRAGCHGIAPVAGGVECERCNLIEPAAEISGAAFF